jgi:Ca-activated chloride channel homolog
MSAVKKFCSVMLLLSLASNLTAATQLILRRGDTNQHPGELKGVIDLAIDPVFDDARVTVVVDGQTVAANVISPYHVVVDFGATAVEHKIAITAKAPNGKRVQWTETINRGMLPLTVKVRPFDAQQRVFEALTTSPKHDPIQVVELWDDGKVVASVTAPPYRFTVPENVYATGFVQVTAKTANGEEAADFWSAAGDVHVEELAVRTVPIFVSVVDRNGDTRDDVDRSQFRILDNNAEGRIIEFGKAFDQPISIALLVDSSASMTYSMKHAAKAAAEFVQRSLRDGDRCSVTAVQDVPRRKISLSHDRDAIAKALDGIAPHGQTALWDALGSAIRELQDEKRRRAIVVLTDGSDTASILTAKEFDKVARQAGIPIYFIAYEGGSEDPKDLDRLKYFAAQTGGFVATATQQDLEARYAAIERDLRAQFAITYQVTDYSKANEYRRVRVVLDSPKLEARTIKGYFTP